MDKSNRFSNKLAEVRRLIKSEHAEAIHLTLQKNISWLIDGRTHVNTASEPACCQFVITENECVYISNNIENKRVLEEEIDIHNEKLITHIEQWSWFEPSQLNTIVQRYISGRNNVKTDGELEAAMVRLRTKISTNDREGIREIGRLTADAIDQAAFDIQRGDTEFHIAGRLAYRCWERGLEPIVNLIAVDERIYSRRHPLPTGRALDQYAMLVVCTRKNGLVLSATRLVHFGPVPENLRKLHNAIVEIDARINDATRPGESLASLFDKLQLFYKEAGYPTEYHNHHQGGLTAYAPRERLAIPTETFKVEAAQLYAWNPSLTGVKSEDTLLVNEHDNEILTVSKNYPQVQVKIGDRVWERPDILVR